MMLIVSPNDAVCLQTLPLCRRHTHSWRSCRAGPRVTYIPPALPDDEDSVFAHYAMGINFDKYDDITVNVSGSNAPPAILVMRLSHFLNNELSLVLKAPPTPMTPCLLLFFPDLLRHLRRRHYASLSGKPLTSRATWSRPLCRNTAFRSSRPAETSWPAPRRDRAKRWEQTCWPNTTRKLSS